MNTYEVMLEQIMKMQSWASQKPVLHKDLLIELYRTRVELEKLYVKSTKG